MRYFPNPRNGSLHNMLTIRSIVEYHGEGLKAISATGMGTVCNM